MIAPSKKVVYMRVRRGWSPEAAASTQVLPRGHKHGHSPRSGRTLTYNTWNCMLTRCYVPSHTRYAIYGGRGVTVCERWRGRDGFANFLADVGERPGRHLTLDRHPDPTGNYEPGNCRWATKVEQALNVRRRST
jgi:hypothetical protein